MVTLPKDTATTGRIESLKARERMSYGGKGRLISDNLRKDEVVAHKLGIGSEIHTVRKNTL